MSGYRRLSPLVATIIGYWLQNERPRILPVRVYARASRLTAIIFAPPLALKVGVVLAHELRKTAV